MNPHCPVGFYWKKDLFKNTPPHLVAIKKMKLVERINFDKKQLSLVSHLLKFKHENIVQFKGNDNNYILYMLRTISFCVRQISSDKINYSGVWRAATYGRKVFLTKSAPKKLYAGLSCKDVKVIFFS